MQRGEPGNEAKAFYCASADNHLATDMVYASLKVPINLMVCATCNRSACMYAQTRLLVLSYRGYFMGRSRI